MGTFQHNQRENEHSSQTLIQPQLEIGKEDDEHEKEANHVADKVMKMSDPEEEEKKKMGDGDSKIRMMSHGAEKEKMNDDEEKIRMMSDQPSIRKMSDGNAGGMAAPQQVEQGIHNSKGGGQSLPADTQKELGGKMGADLSDVNIHTDSNAVKMNKEIGAKAFTHGNDIYFNQGQYNPSSTEGKHLLAHELTHTLQQEGATVKRQKKEDDYFEYVVQKGDTLGKIAQRNKTTVAKLRQLNNIPENSTLIKEGQILKVPKQYETTTYYDLSNGTSYTEKVEIAPETGMSYNELLDDNVHKKDALMDNEIDAFNDFYMILNSASKKEGIQKGAGAIALESVASDLVDLVIDQTLSKLPGASQIGSFGKNIIDGIDAEKSRKARADESNAVLSFVLNEKKRVKDLKGAFASDIGKINSSKTKIYGASDKTKQKELLRKEEEVNYSLLKALGGPGSPAGLLYSISEKWIQGNNTVLKIGNYEEFTGGYLNVHVNKSWQVTKAHIVAPGGQKLAERLMDDSNNSYDLKSFAGPVSLTDPTGFIRMFIYPNGKRVTVGYGFATRKSVDAFDAKYLAKGLPEKTKVLTGD